MTTTNMEEVPLSPSKLNNNLKSPSLRVRSPSAKSNIAISRGDDDSSVDDDRPKMCVSDGSTITCVFNKKRLFGGSALAFVAVVVIMAVAIATRSDGGSSSSANHMSKVATVGGGNSNAAVGTAEVGSAPAPPKVAPVAPKKVTPVAPAKSNFAFKPQVAGGADETINKCLRSYYSGKSGKSGRHDSCSRFDFERVIDPTLPDDHWYSSGKSGKSGYNTCSFGSSGKSGKSGSRNFICDGWYSSGKSGKSNSMPKPNTPEIFQKTGAGCFAVDPRQANAGILSFGQEVCGQLARYEVDEAGDCPIDRFGGPLGTVYAGTTCHSYDSYLLRVECAGDYSIFLSSKQQVFQVPNPPGTGTFSQPAAKVFVTKVPESACSTTSHSGKSGKSGGFLPKFTCPAEGTQFSPQPVKLFSVSDIQGNIIIAETYAVTPGLYQIAVGSPYGIDVLEGTNNLLPECNDDNEAFDYTLKVLPGKI